MLQRILKITHHLQKNQDKSTHDNNNDLGNTYVLNEDVITVKYSLTSECEATVV